MPKSAYKRRGVAGFDPQGCVTFLRRRYPKNTARCVAADTNVPARTIERWLQDDAVPSVGAFAALLRAYGPTFLGVSIPGLAWLARAIALTELEGMTVEIQRLELRRDKVAEACFGRKARR